MTEKQLICIMASILTNRPEGGSDSIEWNVKLAFKILYEAESQLLEYAARDWPK
jgi:hypothetical protein